MENVLEINTIKIQRYYRMYNLKKIWIDIFINYDLNNTENQIFFNFTKILRNKMLLSKVNNFIKKINFIKPCNINSNILLTAFLIQNYEEELLGDKDNRVILDIQILNWSNKLCESLTSLTKKLKYNNILKLITFLNSFSYLFNEWKNFDINRNIQGLIISYHNRREHLEYIKLSEPNIEKDPSNNLTDTINYLESELIAIKTNILIFDHNFDISYLESNYKKIYENIQDGLQKIMENVTNNFKKSYLDMLIEQSNNDNYQVIFDFILETNNRIFELTPKKYKKSIKNKLNSYNYLELLLIKNWDNEIIDYLEFVIDTVILYSSPEDDKENIEWKNLMGIFYEKEFNEGVSRILLEINHKIDIIYHKLSKLI
jgi:hypothetical protein